MFRNRCCILTLTMLLFAAEFAHGQTAVDPANLRGDSAQTRKRLFDARQKSLAGKHAEAIDELQRILDDVGDDLVSADGKHYRPARFLVHQILLALPPEQLKGYQNRVEEPARKLLESGKRDRDPRPLWKLIDRYFVSRPANEGLLLLGDLLFERGQFRTAELLWRRLLPPEAAGAWLNLLAEDPDLSHPLPVGDPAAVRARVALAVTFQGESERARQELLRLAALHPGASGSLGGRSGRYLETLLPYVNDPPQLHLEADAERGWPTLGGSPSRSGRVPGRLPTHWPSQPTWSKPLFKDDTVKERDNFSVLGRRSFAHPVVFESNIYLSDGHEVRAFDLKSGTPSGRPFLLRRFDLNPPDPAFTLAAAEGRLFGRFGTPLLIRNPQKDDESYLSGFAPARMGNAPEQVLHFSPAIADAPSGVWESAPLVARSRMWAALARFDGARVVHAIVCFDLVDPDRAPERTAWVVDVCDGALTPPPINANQREGRPRQELMTLAGRNVVFCSNTGAIVALDAATGRRAWAFRYPRSARRLADAARSPDPAPALAFGGRVFVAPADAEHVYAFDEETGDLLWESGTVEGAQFLGIARNRVIVSTGGSVRGLRGLNVANGSHRSDDGGWVQHAGGGLATSGRGLVSDDLILWPTTAGLWILDPEAGQPQGQIRVPFAAPRDSAYGNLAYADGVLVVVTASEVWGYVAESGPPPLNPERKRFTELIGAIERDLGDGKMTARKQLMDAVKGDLPPSMRAWTAGRLLLLNPNAPPDLQAALTPEMQEEWLHLPDGSLRSLGQLVAERNGEKHWKLSKPVAPNVPGDRTRDDAPTLTAKSRVDHTLRLPTGACPLLSLPGGPLRPRFAFAVSGANLLAIPLDGKAITTRITAGTFTHACECAEGLIAVGPHVVAIYGAGREPLWVFRVPELDSLPSRRGQVNITVGEASQPAILSSLVLAGPWLFGRLGEHTLIVLDLQTRQVAWLLGAHGRPGYEALVFPNTPRFEPHYFVNGEVLIAQLSDGRRWTIQADTGHVLDASGTAFRRCVPAGFGEETARVAWVQPPVEIEPNRLAIADGPGLVRAIDLDTGKASTLYSAEGPSSLSGEPPQVRAWNSNVLVSVRRNHGVELDLAEAGGQPGAWHSPAFFDVSRIELKNADADWSRVYVPAGDKLFAVKLKDGSTAWEFELPDSHGSGGWVVRAGKKAIVVYPEFALPSEPVANVAGRAVRSFANEPLGYRLPVFGFRMYDAWVARTVPVLLIEPQTGKLLERIDVPARGPAATAWFEGDLAAIATSAGVSWLK